MGTRQISISPENHLEFDRILQYNRRVIPPVSGGQLGKEDIGMQGCAKAAEKRLVSGAFGMSYNTRAGKN